MADEVVKQYHVSHCASDFFIFVSCFDLGAMAVGMDMAVLLSPMETLMKEATGLINVMERASTNGMMDVFMMENFWRTSVMERANLPGLMVRFMLVTL
jgi:hypothetical protein